MSVLGSAVDAIVVCFAEAPDVLARDYPELCLEMTQVWDEYLPSIPSLCEV